MQTDGSCLIEIQSCSEQDTSYQGESLSQCNEFLHILRGQTRRRRIKRTKITVVAVKRHKP